ncbi:uncharacterized protein CFAP92 isoform X6 [Acinonyx jubatus]|uniref:Uncharacterized protein CFAP92 isoform X6 n=1 Tax=Acinonyx jubatus TaxID=32536 RepID=A0ABM3PT49_ACIJB|nr:uncharacterized protein CFAP92 isoform X6 [Acinonyx jubatus]
MSLHAWEWEDEDRASMGPMSSMGSFYQSGSEWDTEEYLKVRTQAPESDSDHPCSKSSHGPADSFQSDVPQAVPCKFVISLAFPVTAGHRGKHTCFIEKHKKHSRMDKHASKARCYYHMEYFLLPDDGEPKKIDMVVFPTVAKLFLDSGVKTVRPWQEGDKIWVSWTQTFNINMTKELLKKINVHKITLKVWDTKDKVSRKVRYYRLKTPAYSEDAGSFEEVKNLVLSQRRLCEEGTHIRKEWNQEHAPEKAEKAGKHIKPSHAEPETFSKSSEEYEKALRMDDLGTVRWSTSRESTLYLETAPGMEMKELMERSFSSLTKIVEKQKFQSKRKESEVKKKSQKRKRKSRVEDNDSKGAGNWKHGAFSTELVLMPLLAGWQTVMSCGCWKSASILDCYLSFKTEVPIMTEEQKQDLNPLTIKIKCVSCLPSQPVPIHELEKHQSRTREMQGALQLRATVSPPPIRRPGDRPVPSAPLQAAVAAHEALGALRPQHRSREDLPGPDQDLLYLLSQQQTQGGDHRRPAPILCHGQRLEPGAGAAHFTRRPHRWKTVGLANSSSPQSRGLTRSETRPRL